MDTLNKFFIKFSLFLLFAGLLIGVIASSAFLYPEVFNKHLPFHLLRPMHTSAALFWIICGAAGCICYLKIRQHPENLLIGNLSRLFMLVWMTVIVVAFISYGLGQFGGREYWEFPAYLNLPLLAGWLAITYVVLSTFRKDAPAYEWMWMTGIIFFLITFTEQNLWQLSWFRESYIREVTVQWKANGSMVGAWNQMINGLSVYILIQISGDNSAGTAKKTYFLFFLGLFNLMFNWGHHVYNLPNANWMRGVAYAVSMTEWVILIMIIRSFKKKIEEQRKFSHHLSYRFILSAEIWLFANLFLALLMSIPALNRYTHGTHITVAHAMGTTIGINTLMLLAVIAYLFKADELAERTKKIIGCAIRVNNFSLGIFWLSLIAAGLIKGYVQVNQPDLHFTQLMQPVLPFLGVFAAAGIFVFLTLGTIALIFIRLIGKKKTVLK